jgi:hypothetical protein
MFLHFIRQDGYHFTRIMRFLGMKMGRRDISFRRPHCSRLRAGIMKAVLVDAQECKSPRDPLLQHSDRWEFPTRSSDAPGCSFWSRIIPQRRVQANIQWKRILCIQRCKWFSHLVISTENLLAIEWKIRTECGWVTKGWGNGEGSEWTI